MRWPIEVPLRSLLFVPGDKPGMFKKGLGSGADAVIFDLEDSVRDEAKAEARENVRRCLEQSTEGTVVPLVRINACSTSYWHADVETATCKNLRGILLPKSESADEIASVEQFLTEREKDCGLKRGSVRLLLLIESARGMLQASRLADSSERIVALVFGAEDYCLDMGIMRLSGDNDLLFVRSHLAVVARARDCVCIDSVYGNFRDADTLFRETRASKQLGFSGKLAIHPKQIETIHTALAPSEDELSEAHRIIDAYNRAKAAGANIVAWEGRMIDKPVVERARKIVAAVQPKRDPVGMQPSKDDPPE